MRISVRNKILAIVVGFFSLIVAIFAVYSVDTTGHYRQLRTDAVSSVVAFESERVATMIAEMERNAIDLALAGEAFFVSRERSSDLGAAIVVENFRSFPAAVGGGIWFEPYSLDAQTERVCFYAFFDPVLNAVRHDPDFETAEYNYPTQNWYRTIASGQKSGKKSDTVWTRPYFDASGSQALMTTVGVGIHDVHGKFVGMSTVDWDIQSMVKRLSEIKPTENSFYLLASPHDDYIISHTHGRPVSPLCGKDVNHTNTPLRTVPWYDQLHFAGDGSVGRGNFTENGVKYLTFSRMFKNGWLFSMQIPADEIFADIETRNQWFSIVTALAFVILFAVTAVLLSRLIVTPLNKLACGVIELGGGNLDKHIELPSKDEFGLLAAAFNQMTVDLKASMEQSARERAEKERIGAELDVARQIQASMLPCIFPPFPERTEFDIFASMQPAKEVGGDFYDIFLVDDNTLAVVIADVSGKGVPAALFMVIAKTLIQNTALSGKNPDTVFEVVNKMLCENNEANMFVTAFLGHLDLPTGEFTFANAGHNPPLLKRSGGDFDWLRAKSGMVLAGLEDTIYRQQKIVLNPGDELFLYTDGVTEAMNQESELFGEPRLLDMANRCLDLPPREFTVAIKREIDLFAEGAKQADDITMLALRYDGWGPMKTQMDELVIEATLENMVIVQDFVGTHLTECSAKLRNQISIVVDEIFSNIARYAYHPGTGMARVRIAVGHTVALEFEDDGVAYDPLSVAAPDATLSVEERKIGGMGLYMVKNLMDSVVYRRDGDKNILTLTKNRTERNK